MKRYLLIGIALLVAGTVSAQRTFKYIGADGCKSCHNKPDKGAQYDHWLKDPHSQALKTLSGEKAIAYAKENGIADPSKEAKCLKCHTTYDAITEDLRNGIKQDEAVSCESCHGPGSAYKSPAVMKNRNIALKSGLILPEKEVCVQCHNANTPFPKEFDFEKAIIIASHPDPTRKK